MRKFAVFAHDAATVRSYLQQAVVRQGLQALLDHGFWMVVLDRCGGWAEKLAYDRERDIEVMSVSTFLRCLKLIAAGV